MRSRVALQMKPDKDECQAAHFLAAAMTISRRFIEKTFKNT